MLSRVATAVGRPAIARLAPLARGFAKKDRGIVAWDAELCIQCEECVDVCPQEALASFHVDPELVPAGVATLVSEEDEDNKFIIAVGGTCNGCGECVSHCKNEVKSGALSLVKGEEHKAAAAEIFGALVSYPICEGVTGEDAEDAVDECTKEALEIFDGVLAVSPSRCNGCEDCEDFVKGFSNTAEHKAFVREQWAKLSGEAPLEECAGAVGPEIVSYSAGDETQENLIVSKRELSPNIVELVVHTPDIAQNVEAGHFLVVHAAETAERIPLTVADYDREKATITMVIQDVGLSSKKILSLKAGDKLESILGPLGRPTEIEDYGKVVVVGGGVGVAPVHPIAKALKEAGNEVVSIMGARNHEMLFWEDEMRAASSELHVCTDDGSYAKKGFVTQALEELIQAGEKFEHCWAIGPAPMMAAVADLTKKYDLPTTVSINSIMVDGTGMCGGCRVQVGDETKFTCVDGPEFDAHKLDFKGLLTRHRGYHAYEAESSALLEDELAAEAASREAAADRVPMPEQDAAVRARNFDEVALGYTEYMARSEALRCLQCKKPGCKAGCPVNIRIPEFIAEVAEGNFLKAFEIISESNSLPAVTGRVCPQENQCEKFCVFNKPEETEQPVAIGRLERFVADYAAKYGPSPVKPAVKATGKKVAIIGAGPAGLTAAGDLIKEGHDVTVFEALHKLGGVLAYGIPEFRLPKAIVQREALALQAMGVDYKLNKPIGPCGTVQSLLSKKGYDAAFLGLGAGLPYFLGIPGEGLNGVYSSNEFLTRVNLMKAYRFPEYDTPVQMGKNVAVVGGGNVAMDAARCALRLGAENVYLVYRRTRAEMPARAEEVHHAFEEGVQLQDLTAPLELIPDENQWVSALRCQKMKLGEPDASGRRRPEPTDEIFDLKIDQFIVAVGNGANPMLTQTFPELKLNEWGNIEADAEGRTSVKGVFAGGDIVTGGATVILAMGAGRTAATSMHNFLMTGSCKAE
jgi:glutamate synthase (NADPH/NADH) small chain